MNISEEWSHLNNLDDDRLYEMAMELRPDIHSIEVQEMKKIKTLNR